MEKDVRRLITALKSHTTPKKSRSQTGKPDINLQMWTRIECGPSASFWNELNPSFHTPNSIAYLDWEEDLHQEQVLSRKFDHLPEDISPGTKEMLRDKCECTW